MKKITCMLLTLVMLLGMVAFAESTDLAGEWKLSLLSDGEDEYNPADLGMDMVMVLAADGTAKVVTAGQEDMNGTWIATADGANITIEGDEMAFALMEGFLVMDDGDIIMLFEKVGLAGVWYLMTMSDGETEYSVADIGMDMILTLYNDGSAVFAVTGEEDENGTWTEIENGVEVTIDGDPLVFILTDGALVADMEGVVMVFGREKVEAFAPGSPIAAASVEDFNGTWSCVKIDMMDIVMSADLMGVEGSVITIANGAFTQENIYSDTDFWGENNVLTGSAALVDGSLSLTGAGLEDYTVTLYDSGILAVVEMYAGVIPVTFYYELAE